MHTSNRKSGWIIASKSLPNRRISGAGDASDSRWWMELLRAGDDTHPFGPDEDRGERRRSCQSLQW